MKRCRVFVSSEVISFHCCKSALQQHLKNMSFDGLASPQLEIAGQQNQPAAAPANAAAAPYFLRLEMPACLGRHEKTEACNSEARRVSNSKPIVARSLPGLYHSLALVTVVLSVLSCSQTVHGLYSQDGFGFSGVVNPNPLRGNITMTGYTQWPVGFTKGVSAFLGAVFDGRFMWMVPHYADRVVRIDTTDNGTMTGFTLPRSNTSTT